VEWRTDAETVEAHRLDRSGWDPGFRPLGVAFASSVADVQTVLRDAAAVGASVTVRGAGTGLSGGAVAPNGSVVLDLSRLDAIREISVADQVAVVEPGVITAALGRAAGERGLRYAPDPASLEISTIGGNIATNAGGLRCAKYGVTRDSVLALDVVLADGSLIHTGHRSVKGVAGYDLTGLFVGSEGTLGVVVGATLRLRPAPAETATIAAYFDSLASAASAVREIAAAGVVASTLEIVDGPTLGAIDAAQGSDLRTRGEAFLLVQTDGPGAVAEASTAEKALLGLASSLERLGRVLIEDIAVPPGRLAEAASGVAEIAAETGAAIYTLAHAGDGNLHPLIVVDRSSPAIPDNASEAAERIFALALQLGGTVTGEHGVGALKRRWLGKELGERQHRLQRDLRAVFDPTGLLNPGRAL
jgi:glycolate oxidase